MPRALAALVVLSVLMLAAAAGLGAAVLLRSRPHTWTSTSAVRVLPGPAPTIDPPAAAISSAMTRGAVHVAYSTALVRDTARIPARDLRGDLSGKAVAPDQVVITARARDAAQAEQLAQIAAEALQQWIGQDQQQRAATPGDRLDSVISRAATNAELTDPSRTRIATAAGVAAAVVLLLALLVRRLVRRRSRG
jgi:hypothetical protein